MHTLTYDDPHHPDNPKQTLSFTDVDVMMRAIGQLPRHYNVWATVRTACNHDVELSRMSNLAYLEVGRVMAC